MADSGPQGSGARPLPLADASQVPAAGAAERKELSPGEFREPSAEIRPAAEANRSVAPEENLGIASADEGQRAPVAGELADDIQRGSGAQPLQLANASQVPAGAPAELQLGQPREPFPEPSAEFQPVEDQTLEALEGGILFLELAELELRRTHLVAAARRSETEENILVSDLLFLRKTVQTSQKGGKDQDLRDLMGQRAAAAR